ncbi:MAG: HAMP domain-containing protein [Alphaproteobacteria bacterium]|nr:HAMP domain-containing protein [Alphaproteobacteria bacterium]MCB9795704.1 HAMP domain-containing protein [Alphaproteobacteria bacterium]
MISPLQRGLLASVLVAIVIGVGSELRLRDRVDVEAEALQSIAAEAAAELDAGAHARIRGPADAEGPEFQRARAQLREVHDRYDLRSPVYTLRRAEAGQTRFVVMTNLRPFIGDRYAERPEMQPVFEAGERARTGLYRSASGWWVSGFAPVLREDGQVEALVSVDRPSRDLLARRHQGVLLALVLGLLTGALVHGLTLFVRREEGMALLAILQGRLARRIGISAAITGVLAVAVMSGLGHVRDREDLIDGRTQALLQAARVGALSIDGDLHARVDAQADPSTPEFLALRQQLRAVQEAAGLSTPVYTLARVGEATRFVGMTQEEAFIGDAYELRPGVRASFEGGGAGSEGPYGDAHGQWISAWAPILDGAGEVVAVLQVDAHADDLVVELMNRDIQRLLIALLTGLVAVLVNIPVSRGIARPVEQVAEAARRIERGQLDVQLPEAGHDEVGQLVRSVNRMARGLREREQLRNMFGKYMATQVVQELMSAGELSLRGELREVTVLISDIRGYTALTEELGATEVVALLNEYFSILVDVVLEGDGVIDKFMGDALLCWFGAPVPSEDHPEKAVAAAERILERTAAWNAERVARGLSPVATGIGLALGTVVVGNIGSPQRLEYTAIGDAVNLASRLCSMAEAGEVLLTKAVRDAVPGAAHERVGPVEVKGVKDPVEVYRRRLPVVG